MTVRQLRESIAKFGNDDNDSQVILSTLNEEKETIEYHDLAFTALFSNIDHCIVLGSKDVALLLIKNGKINGNDLFEDGETPNY